MKTKICRSRKYPELACGLEKPIDQFSQKSSLCKDCQKKYQKQYRDEHKREAKEYQKKYQEDNKEELTEYKKQWYEDNKEEIKEAGVLYRQTHKEEIKIRNKIYNTNNKGKINRKKNIRIKKLWKEDPIFRLRSRISNAVGYALRTRGSSKRGHSIMEYLGYTMPDLKEHIETLFEPWMNWDNWGKYDPKTWNDNDQATWKWQLDHIIPQSALPFKSMKSKNFKKCWSLENLRPLSAKQNFLLGVEVLKRKKAARGNK